MPKDINHIIVSYDIHDHKRLARIAKIMNNYGERVLKSVFECSLDEAWFNEMKNRVEEKIDHMEDSVRYYFLCDKCMKNISISGLGRNFKKDDSFIIR